jgi:hypothetical protein
VGITQFGMAQFSVNLRENFIDALPKFIENSSPLSNKAGMTESVRDAKQPGAIITQRK